VRQSMPWLYQSYRGEFLALAGEACVERVVAARDDRYGAVLNVQRGTTMRFECHIDSNPLTGLLFCTDHPAGGELVFAHDANAADVAAVERDCSVIRPHAGHLIFFDARQHPHYARPLAASSDMRIVAVMNFYTDSCPESTRPQELNTHLYGDE
jgi:2OG-Fe(II) oxygenase superfamily